ncbi:MAG TPA: hypothetical protein VF595_12790 [Tepidisphaeraceae bacterium]|jgi:hypothetical protein
MYLLIAIAMLGGNGTSAQWAQRDEPQLLVEFRLTLTPDKEGESFGAVPLSNQVGMTGGLWQDRFTGAGCIPGPFELAQIDLWSSSGGVGRSFRVSCRSRSRDDEISLMEWKGVLEDGKISGDVWIMLPGTPLTHKQVVARKQADKDRETKKRAVTIDGRLANGPEIEEAIRILEVKNVLLPAEGRKLHFTFTTAEVVIIPVGNWSDRKRPATQPSAVAPAGN